MAFEFLDTKAGGIDFSGGIISVHPELKSVLCKSEDEQKKIINDYFDKFYEENSSDINRCLLLTIENWKKDEEKFIERIDIIFKNPQVPEGRYIGYLSIINCNPRFLEDKTFQFFYKHPNGSNLVTAHEVLHFFFYDYAERKYPEIFGKLDQNSGLFWIMAELFNDVVMSAPDFMSEEYSERAKPYPDHVKYFDKVKAFWDKSRDLDSWLIESHKYLTSVI